jgi:hypothetical protein
MPHKYNTDHWYRIPKTRYKVINWRDHPPTTAPGNGSGQAMRPCAVFRKIANRFRSQCGAKLCINVRSIVGSSGNATYNILYIALASGRVERTPFVARFSR